MSRIPKSGLTVAFVMVIALLVVNAIVTYRNTVLLRSQADDLDQTHTVIEAITSVRSAMKDTEKSGRGFLFTGEDSYLQPYMAGVASIERAMSELTHVVADDPEQTARTSALDGLVHSALRELDSTIALRRAPGFDAASDPMVTDSGKRDMDAIGLLLAAMRDEQQARVRDAQAVGDAAFRTAILSTLITTVGSILLFSAVVVLFRRNTVAGARTASALAVQSDILRTTLASIVEGIFVTDAKGLVTYVNPVAETMSGRSLADVAGRPVATLVDLRDPTSDVPVPNGALSAIQRGVVEATTNRRVLVAHGGTRLAVEEVSTPVRDDEGKIVGSVLAVRDVTSQLRDEALIGRARAYAESIVDTVTDPLAILDRDGRVRSANLAFFSLFQSSEANTVGKPIFALEGVRWDTSAVRTLLDEASAHSTGEDSIELDCVLSDGRQRILNFNARRLRGQGEHTNFMLLAVRDVTDRRDNERRVTQLLEDERETAIRLREIASASLTLNAAHSRNHVLEVLRDEARSILESETATVTLDSTAPLGGEEALAAPLIGRDGQTLGWVRLHGVSRRGGHSRENDESMLRQLAHVASVAMENARLYEELREGDRRKDEFLATLAHELRNPLAPVRNSVQILRAPALDAGMRDVAIATIDRQVSLLVRLVDDLLDVSRITRGKIALKIEVIDLAEIVGRALEISRPIVDASGHGLSVQLPSQRTLLYVDGSRIAQVLANLLNNAAKYTDRGGNIRLSCTVEKDEVVISVRDDGLGIPPEMLPHIFTMFWQVGHALERAQGGLGIGLTLVKQLVDLHGGRVEARSAGVGRGSEFIVRLPIAEAEAVRAAPGPNDARAQAPMLSTARRILVVDDNVDSAESLAILLRFWGHEVQTAHDGEEALLAVEAVHPELVLLDIGLPRLDGLEVARILRARHGRAFTIVAMTGFGRAEDRMRSLAAGFDHHLVKPVDPLLLNSILRELETART